MASQALVGVFILAYMFGIIVGLPTAYSMLAPKLQDKWRARLSLALPLVIVLSPLFAIAGFAVMMIEFGKFLFLEAPGDLRKICRRAFPKDDK